MLKMNQRFDEYSYRIADGVLDSSVTELKEGQWVTFNASGNLVISTGAAGVKSFIVMGSKRTGRNQVAGVAQKVSFLHGAFRLETDQYDSEATYATTMTALKVTTGGVLTPIVTTGATPDTADKIVAYAQGQPVNGYLRIYSA